MVSIFDIYRNLGIIYSDIVLFIYNSYREHLHCKLLMADFTTLGNLFHNICCNGSMRMLPQGWSGPFYPTIVLTLFKNKLESWNIQS